MNLMINDRASACITNNLTDFVGRSHRINQEIKGIAGHAQVTEFRQPLQVQSHLEMPRILVQLGHTQRT